MRTSIRPGIVLLLAALAVVTLATVSLAAPASQAEDPDTDVRASPGDRLLDVSASPEPRGAFLERIDPQDAHAQERSGHAEEGSLASSPSAPPSPLASWSAEDASMGPMQVLERAPVADASVPEGCAPHPPISITEEVGDEGFILGQDPVTGEPIYRPGSGVVDGEGTEDDPYVIEDWCIEAPGNPQGQPTCIIVPGVEPWCGDVPNDIVEAPDAAIAIRGTDAHVSVRENVVTGSTVSVEPTMPSANGIVLDEVANVTVEDNVAALTSSGVVVLDSQDVEIAGNTIVYALSSGVVTADSTAVTIAGNEALASWRGLWILDAGTETVVEGNRITQASFEGIRVQSSEQAQVVANRVDGVGTNMALRLEESTGLRLAGNALVGGGVATTGDALDHYVHEVRDTNLVNGEPLVYLHEDHGARVEEPVGQLLVVDTNGVRADGIHVQQAAYGIHVVDSAGVRILDALVEDTRNGIVLDGTTAARVSGSAVHGASPAPGILVDGADQTTLEANDVTASGFDGGLLASAGIVVTGSEETHLADNAAMENEGFGIGVWGGSTDTQLREDEAHGNALDGIVVGGAGNTELRSVDAAGNGGFGVDVRGTETTVEEALLASNADGGLRMYQAVDANLTATRIVDPGEAEAPADALLGDAAANGIELWDTEGAILEANTVRDHANGTALLGANEDVVVRGNEIAENAIGVWVEAGLVGQPEDLRLAQNTIEANTDRGLHAQNLDQPLDVRDNWWGHASGPEGEIADACTDTLADGDGQAITTREASVCFDPWLEEAPS